MRLILVSSAGPAAVALAVASGGLSLGGSAVVGVRPAASGGLTLSGAVAASPGESTSGGLSLSGSARVGVAPAPSGGLALAGTSRVGVRQVASGGLTASGSPSPITQGTAAATGGLVVSGSAATTHPFVRASSGGLTISGGATASPRPAISGGLAASGGSTLGVRPAARGGPSLSGGSRVGVGELASGGLSVGGSAVPRLSLPTTTIAPPGYFTHYFTGNFTLYFPGSGSTGVALATGLTPAPSGYFTGYFPSYFTDYFPGAGGVVLAPGAAVPVPVLPGTFLAAVRKALRGDATLMGMLRGGVWHRYAPPDSPEPVLVFIAPTIDRNPSTTAADYIEAGQLQLSVYGPKDSAARDAANRAVAVLTDAPLRWVAGTTFYLRPSNPSSPNLPQLGYGGSKVFGEVRVLDFKNFGNFAAG